MVEPTKRKPRCVKSLLRASDSLVRAGTLRFQAFCLGLPFTKRQTYASKLPNSCCTFSKAWVADGGCDFQAIADDAGIGKQLPYFFRVVAGDLLRVEAVEDFSIAFTLAQHGVPA